jgi:hypothetical protein
LLSIQSAQSTDKGCTKYVVGSIFSNDLEFLLVLNKFLTRWRRLKGLSITYSQIETTLFFYIIGIIKKAGILLTLRLL